MKDSTMIDPVVTSHTNLLQQLHRDSSTSSLESTFTAVRGDKQQEQRSSDPEDQRSSEEPSPTTTFRKKKSVRFRDKVQVRKFYRPKLTKERQWELFFTPKQVRQGIAQSEVFLSYIKHYEEEHRCRTRKTDNICDPRCIEGTLLWALEYKQAVARLYEVCFQMSNIHALEADQQQQQEELSCLDETIHQFLVQADKGAGIIPGQSTNSQTNMLIYGLEGIAVPQIRKAKTANRHHILHFLRRIQEEEQEGFFEDDSIRMMIRAHCESLSRPATLFAQKMAEVTARAVQAEATITYL